MNKRLLTVLIIFLLHLLITFSVLIIFIKYVADSPLPYIDIDGISVKAPLWHHIITVIQIVFLFPIVWVSGFLGLESFKTISIILNSGIWAYVLVYLYFWRRTN
ncbi:MAG: hypothetical protein JW866_02430 [Ignavibacteriales bacterium]|nr:hypothetical protein [Ignavibacteriales bacterium]